MSRPAALLDRDGVINVDHGYVHRWEQFEFVAGSVDAMRRLHRAGWPVVVVTNQSGIGRGHYTEGDFHALDARMRAHLAGAGAPVAGVFHCPHRPPTIGDPLDPGCACRKPLPGLFLQAAAALGLDLPASFAVGDKIADVVAARSAGVGRAYLVRSGQPLRADDEAGADAVFANLAAAVDRLLDGEVRAAGRSR